MRNLLGRLRRSGSRSLVEQLATLTSVGDGSTLSLDFTTGVLDSRLTFTRASNATFINSSGFVEWSASNHAPRTNWNFTSPTGNGWNAATVSGTGTFQWVGNGTVIAASGSAGQSFTVITTSSGISQGLRYVMSVTALSVTGNPTIQSIFDFTDASGNTYFKNGAAATSGTTVASGDRISVSAIANSTTMNVRLGCGAWFANRTNESVTLTQFHWHPGSAPVAYYENTGTSPEYDSARFDYDPTTGAPRGLLVEGQVTNLLNWSESFATSGGTNNNWADTSITRTTGQADPANGTTAIRFTASAGNATVISSATIGTSAERTFSVWLRRVTGTGNIQYTQNNGTNWTTQAITATWTRYTFTHTVDHRVGIRIVTSGDAIEMWGAQLETGSGASSYIPTGSGQGTRNADVCYMANADYGFSTSGGTYLAEWHRGSNITTGSTGNNAFATDYASGRWLGIYTSGASSTGTAGSWAGYLNSSGNAVAGLNKMAVSYSSWIASASGNASLNGGAIVSGTLTLGTTPTYLFVGAASGTSPYSGGGYRDPLNNCVRRIKYWPSVLPNAQLQSLTT